MAPPKFKREDSQKGEESDVVGTRAKCWRCLGEGTIQEK